MSKLEYERCYKGKSFDNLRRCSIVSSNVYCVNNANSNPITRADIDLRRIIEQIKSDLDNAKRTNSARLSYFLEIETDNKTFANFWSVGIKDNRKNLLCKITIIKEVKSEQ